MNAWGLGLLRGFVSKKKKKSWREVEGDTNVSLWPPDSSAHVCRDTHEHTHAYACSTHREEHTSRSTETYFLELIKCSVCKTIMPLNDKNNSISIDQQSRKLDKVWGGTPAKQTTSALREFNKRTPWENPPLPSVCWQQSCVGWQQMSPGQKGPRTFTANSPGRGNTNLTSM